MGDVPITLVSLVQIAALCHPLDSAAVRKSSTGTHLVLPLCAVCIVIRTWRQERVDGIRSLEVSDHPYKSSLANPAIGTVDLRQLVGVQQSVVVYAVHARIVCCRHADRDQDEDRAQQACVHVDVSLCPVGSTFLSDDQVSPTRSKASVWPVTAYDV